MEQVSVLEYLDKIGILWDSVQYNYNKIPNDIEGLLDLLDDLELNYWSYTEEDKDEIKDMSKVVLVKDNEGAKRYFELEETESF